jgi:DNA-binding MarR family transcriptional regulator
MYLSTHVATDCSLVPCNCTALRRASRAVTSFYDLVLAPTGLKATQFIMLKTVHEHGEIAQCSYARDEYIAIETLSRRLGALRRKGLLQMRIGGRHGERMYSLTERGREAFEQGLPYWQRAQERLKSVLGESDLKALWEICERVCNAAHLAEVMRTKNGLKVSKEHPDSAVA